MFSSLFLGGGVGLNLRNAYIIFGGDIQMLTVAYNSKEVSKIPKNMLS